MRISITFLALFVVFGSFAQEKVKYNGLNRNAPHSNSFGLKGQANYYFASFKAVTGDADSSSVSGSDLMGGGFGAYFRYDLKENIGIQSELLIHHRQGRAVGLRKYILDTAMTLYNEELSSYEGTWIEIPVYLKYRREFTYSRGGHWKPNSSIGIYLGPRAVITPYSRRKLSRSTYTVLYDQRSYDVQNNIDSDYDNTPRFAPIAGLGIAAGVDFEFRNGLLFHAAFYKGLLSHSKASLGYKTFDNRIEVGLGFRIY